jgi:hypothetical protein
LPSDFIVLRFNSHCNSSIILCRTIQYKPLSPMEKPVKQLGERSSKHAPRNQVSPSPDMIDNPSKKRQFEHVRDAHGTNPEGESQ